MLLEGKIAVVTGGGSGLGEAICKLYAKEGANVVVADSNFVGAKRVSDEINELFTEKIPMQHNEELKERNYRTIPVCVDVTNRPQIAGMVMDVIHTFGKIDILVNCAGIVKDKTLLKMPDDWFDAVIDVNLKGVYNVTKAIAPHMVENRYGRIINISSVVRNGNRGQTPYSASKAAVVAMSNTWAREFATKGITSNCVAPGFMKTNMTAGMKPEVLKATEEMIPMKHLGNPEDIARACLFLAEEKNDYITGMTLDVNGGLVI